MDIFTAKKVTEIRVAGYGGNVVLEFYGQVERLHFTDEPGTLVEVTLQPHQVDELLRVVGAEYSEKTAIGLRGRVR